MKGYNGYLRHLLKTSFGQIKGYPKKMIMMLKATLIASLPKIRRVSNKFVGTLSSL